MKTPNFLKHTLLSTLLLLNAFSASAEMNPPLAVGFNQGWIFNRYGTQWVGGFDENEFTRVIDLTKNAHGSLLRLWLFEGYFSDAIIWNNGEPVGLKPEFLVNLRKVLAAAKARGVNLNLTLLDANMGKTKPPAKESEYFWWNLLNNKYDARQKFIQNVWIPLLTVLAEPANAGVASQIDLVNEINALTKRSFPIRFDSGWRGANQFICDMKNAKGALAPMTKVSASLGWGTAVDDILNKNLDASCVEFLDFHLYSDSGNIPRCFELVQFAKQRGMQIQLGEFGQNSHSINDSLQTSVTRNYLNNAARCGLNAAMGWRLAEPESNAYLSYERNGQLRPAYREFLNH